MSVSLKESCLRILTAHSAGLVDVGTCPFSLIRPVLFGCPPDQLAQIEDSSPHLMLESDEIWALHLRRDYPTETASAPVKHTLNTTDPQGSDDTAQEVDLPPNRVKYYEMRASKAQALVTAAAKLRERTLANRSEVGKRKAIFTGEADRGLMGKRKKITGSSSRAWGGVSSPSAPKTLAEKARQQVKKSASVYANASRPTPTPPSTSTSTKAFNPSLSLLKPSSSISTPSLFNVRRSPGNPASKCVVRKPNIIVKLVPAKTETSSEEPVSGAVKPTPFGNTSRRPVAPPIRVIKTIIPAPRPTNKQPSSSSSLKPGPNTPAGPTSSKAGVPSNAPLVNRSTTSKVSSLFMPKVKKPPPPAPSRSLVSVPSKPINSSGFSRMSQLPKR